MNERFPQNPGLTDEEKQLEAILLQGDDGLHLDAIAYYYQSKYSLFQSVETQNSPRDDETEADTSHWLEETAQSFVGAVRTLPGIANADETLDFATRLLTEAIDDLNDYRVRSKMPKLDEKDYSHYRLLIEKLYVASPDDDPEMYLAVYIKKIHRDAMGIDFG